MQTTWMNQWLAVRRRCPDYSNEKRSLDSRTYLQADIADKSLSVEKKLEPRLSVGKNGIASSVGHIVRRSRTKRRPPRECLASRHSKAGSAVVPPGAGRGSARWRTGDRMNGRGRPGAG